MLAGVRPYIEPGFRTALDGVEPKEADQLIAVLQGECLATAPHLPSNHPAGARAGAAHLGHVEQGGRLPDDQCHFVPTLCGSKLP